MIEDILSDLVSPTTSFLMKCVIGMLILIVFAAVGMMFWLVFDLINTSGVKATKKTEVVVKSKYIRPAHSTTELRPVGDVLVPFFEDQPESYGVTFVYEGREHCFTVGSWFYDQIYEGEMVEVTFGQSRLTRKNTPVSLRLLRS